MTELDLTEAIEAGRDAGLATQCEREPSGCMGECYDAAVRAAAPIIERAVREQERKPIGYRFIDPNGSGWLTVDPRDVEIIYPWQEGDPVA